MDGRTGRRGVLNFAEMGGRTGQKAKLALHGELRFEKSIEIIFNMLWHEVLN